MKLLILVTTWLLRYVVEGSNRKVSKRHAEIIDSLAALPPRKKVKGVSLELDAQKQFQEEGLAALNGSTLRKCLRASAVKQGTKIVTEAHREIIRELPAGIFGVENLYQIASQRFVEAGLEKLTDFTFRAHLKYLGYTGDKAAPMAEQQEVNDQSEELSSNICPPSDETENFNLPVKKQRVRFSKAHKEFLLEFLSKPMNAPHEKKEHLWKEVSEEFEKRGLKRVSRKTLWKHLKMMNSADLSQKSDDEDITVEDEDLADAVGGLLFLRNGHS